MNGTFLEAFSRLKEIMSEVDDLKKAEALLSWDQNVFMPSLGSEARGRQISTLAKVAHEKMVASEVGNLLNTLSSFPMEKDLSYDSFEASFLRSATREYEKSIKVPSSVIAEILSHQSTCYSMWLKARADNNFKLIQPYLEKTLELSQKYSSYFKYEHIADPLIAEGDYGFTAKKVKEVFTNLRTQLVPFVKNVLKIENSDDSFLYRNYSLALQEKFGKEIVEKIGYDFNRGRLDITHHPFMTSFALNDVRITTRYKENNLCESLFSTIHEAGHALYELGNDKALDGSLLFGGTSSGVHESQSRLWENLVGKSFEFWHYFYPKLQKVFAGQLHDISLYEFYAGINKVSRSLIRTDADELTYNLHVMIRFDLELEMLEGKLKIKDLPDAWNARYFSDLGISVPSDANGCLQDVHWYAGLIGGQFQGYTLGNIMSAQFYEKASASIPNLAGQIKNGDFSSLKNWLDKNLYQHGKKYTGEEVLKIATNCDLNINSYMNYLRNKFPVNKHIT